MVLQERYETEKRRKDREKIIEARTHLLDQGRWFPVRYCSQIRFSQAWRSSLSDSDGILSIVNSRATYFFLKSGKVLEITFDLHKSKIEWIGRKLYLSGGFNWLMIKYSSIEYYFTAETGTGLKGTMEKTHKIYDELLLASRSTET
jgi:hypothetical protein